jgi:hypothetical protein
MRPVLQYKKDCSIYGFIHIMAVNDYQDIVNSFVKDIMNSGLYDKCKEIQLGVLGEFDETYFSKLPKKFKVKYKSSNVLEYEFPTLNLLYQKCLLEDCKVFYIHTKGVSVKDKRYRERCNGWRKYMEYFIVGKHKDCIKYLEEYDAVGCEHITFRVFVIFSGNFWWAKSDYIKKLRPIYSLNIKGRGEAESWLLNNNIDKKVKEIYKLKRKAAKATPNENEYKNK